MPQFQEFWRNKAGGDEERKPLDIDLLCLTKSFWNLKSGLQTEPIVPPEMLERYNLFRDFFCEKYNKSRKVSLVLSESQSEMFAHLGTPEKKYILVLTNFQMIVLLNLNHYQGKKKRGEGIAF